MPSPLPPQPVHTAVVPAAGLGTRLLPATLLHAKELLPLGLYPALCAPLLEAQAAGLDELIVVTSPGKEDLVRFLRPEGWGALGEYPAVTPLRELVGAMRVRITEQPSPLGVLDAIERGFMRVPRRDGHPQAAPCAVLFPDLIHLPDQRALGLLLAAHAETGGTVFGLFDPAQAPAGRHGPSAQVLVEGGDPAPGEVRRISRVAPPPGVSGPLPHALRTTFGTIHTPAYSEVLDRLARPGPGALLADTGMIAALDALAAQGDLFGVLLPGEVIDIGHAAGYLDAARRFATGEARWRGLT